MRAKFGDACDPFSYSVFFYLMGSGIELINNF